MLLYTITKKYFISCVCGITDGNLQCRLNISSGSIVTHYVGADCGCVGSIYHKYLHYSGPGSSAGIETDYGLDGPGSSPGGDPASSKMGTGSFPGVKCGRGVLLTTHPLLVPRSWKSRAIPLPTLWATPDL